MKKLELNSRQMKNVGLFARFLCAAIIVVFILLDKPEYSMVLFIGYWVGAVATWFAVQSQNAGMLESIAKNESAMEHQREAFRIQMQQLRDKQEAKQ